MAYSVWWFRWGSPLDWRPTWWFSAALRWQTMAIQAQGELSQCEKCLVEIRPSQLSCLGRRDAGRARINRTFLPKVLDKTTATCLGRASRCGISTTSSLAGGSVGSIPGWGFEIKIAAWDLWVMSPTRWPLRHSLLSLLKTGPIFFGFSFSVVVFFWFWVGFSSLPSGRFRSFSSVLPLFASLLALCLSDSLWICHWSLWLTFHP